MSASEPRESEKLAAAIFDEHVVALARSKAVMSEGLAHHFDASAKPQSYFEERGHAPEDPGIVNFPGKATPEGLVDALVEYWKAQGNAELAALAPQFRALVAVLRSEEAEMDGDVDIFCYTLF